jgi:uncharacterized membrane protein
MQKSGGIRAGFQGLEGMVVPVKIKALADLRSSDYRWIAGIAVKVSTVTLLMQGLIGIGVILLITLGGWFVIYAGLKD